MTSSALQPLSSTIAALYVLRDGPYFGLPGVDPWDESRDARTYPGPYPVVAHPPCERWGRYWNGGPASREVKKLGDDGGCFAAALLNVRAWGGILEHPEGSLAWPTFGLPAPPRAGGWLRTFCGGWTCCVEQGHYGHPARKATWLFAFGANPPELIWGKAGNRRNTDDCKTEEERRRRVRTGSERYLSARQRKLSPIPFRDMLIDYARSCWGRGDLERVAC